MLMPMANNNTQRRLKRSKSSVYSEPVSGNSRTNSAREYVYVYN